MRLRYRLAFGFALTAAGLWSATGAAGPAAAYTALPAHVYAPYYETYLAPGTPSISATAQQSGAKYFTLAFLQSAGKGSCSLDWNGSSAQLLMAALRVCAESWYNVPNDRRSEPCAARRCR